MIDQAGERMERRMKEASRSPQKLMNKDCGMKISEQWNGLMRREL